VELTSPDPGVALASLVGERVVVLHGPIGADDLSGNDVDCLVDRTDFLWPLRLTGGWQLCQWFRYDLRGWFWIVERDGEFLALDTVDDPMGLGRDALRTREIIGSIHGEPGASLRAAYLTIKRIRKVNVEPSEWLGIGALASQDPNGYLAELELVAGRALASLLGERTLEGVAPDPTIVRQAGRARWIRRFGSPGRIVGALSLGAQRYVQRVVHPDGLRVLVVGPDGAGKSTLAEALPDVTRPMFKRHAHSHWRPGLLPRPGAILGRATSDSSRPHGRHPYGPLVSTLLLGYYWLDFLVGGLVRDVPVVIRTGLVVRERGWWDLVVDPVRYRLQVSPRLVKALGTLLPRPNLVIVLDGDPDLLRERKAELDRDEIERQLAAWHSALPRGVPAARIDISRSSEDVLRAARDAVTASMESRGVSRLGMGWVALPGGRTRWWLPRGPRGAAAASLAVYQPATGRALLGWSIAKRFATLGGFRVLPRGSAPPRSVRQALAPHVPPRGTFAVARATHPGRFVALLLHQDGRPCALAKIATSPEGREALRQEAIAIERFSGMLPLPIAVSRLLHHESGLLLIEALDWIPRMRPWVLEEDVASALGSFFRAGMRTVDGEAVGPAHGDCAPWNLLRTSVGWSLVDWEGAGEAPAFHDLCHYVVQSHALLGRPSAPDVIAGFAGGTGWVGRAIGAYADAAGIEPRDATAALLDYLRRTIDDQMPRSRSEHVGVDRRRRLLDRLDA
jgi:hypothetical protein